MRSTASAIDAASGDGPRNVPDAPREKVLGEVVRLSLHVLRERKCHGTRLRLVDEHAHRRQCRGHQLFRPFDAIEVARHRLQGVVDRNVARVWDPRAAAGRGRAPRCEHIAGQQQHRQPVDGRQRGAGDEVRRAGADRSRACERREPVLHARETDRGMHHRLLVACLVVRQQIGVLVQRLADPGDVAVPEDSEAPFEETLLDSVALDVLRGEEPDERL